MAEVKDEQKWITDYLSVCRCGVISTLAAGATATFSCGGMVGRYMVVHIIGQLKILSLVEAGVYGTLAGNLLL